MTFGGVDDLPNVATGFGVKHQRSATLAPSTRQVVLAACAVAAAFAGAVASLGAGFAFGVAFTLTVALLVAASVDLAARLDRIEDRAEQQRWELLRQQQVQLQQLRADGAYNAFGARPFDGGAASLGAFGASCGARTTESFGQQKPFGATLNAFGAAPTTETFGQQKLFGAKPNAFGASAFGNNGGRCGADVCNLCNLCNPSDLGGSSLFADSPSQPWRPASPFGVPVIRRSPSPSAFGASKPQSCWERGSTPAGSDAGVFGQKIVAPAVDGGLFRAALDADAAPPQYAAAAAPASCVGRPVPAGDVTGGIFGAIASRGCCFGSGGGFSVGQTRSASNAPQSWAAPYARSFKEQRQLVQQRLLEQQRPLEQQRMLDQQRRHLFFANETAADLAVACAAAPVIVGKFGADATVGTEDTEPPR